MENKETKYVQVPYLDEWTDEFGFMSNALEWFDANKQDGVQYYGARHAIPVPEPFTMRTTKTIIDSTGVVEMTLKNGHHVVMEADSIQVYDGQYTRSLLKRYLRFVVNGKLVWRISKEIKEVFYQNLDCAPATLNHFVAQFVRVAIEIIRTVPDQTNIDLNLRNNMYRTALLTGGVMSMMQLQRHETTDELCAIYADFYKSLEIAREWGRRDKLQTLFQGTLMLDTSHAVIEEMIKRVRPYLPRKQRATLTIKLDDNDPNPSATVERLIAEHRSQFQDCQDEDSE